MKTKAKSKFVETPLPFISGKELGGVLDAIDSGLTFLVAMTEAHENDPDFLRTIALTVASGLQPMVNDIREKIGAHSPILNGEHPQYEDLCRSVHAAVKAGQVEQPAVPQIARVKKSFPFLLDPRPSISETGQPDTPVA
jgi:hypothetical protein